MAGVGAVALRLVSETRRSWRSLLGLTLVVGIVGGLVSAAAAGARRTDSAYDRYLDASRAFDAIVWDDGSQGPEYRPDLEAIERLPEVVDSSRLLLTYLSLGAGVTLVAGKDERFGAAVNRVEVLEGRRPGPEASGGTPPSRTMERATTPARSRTCCGTNPAWSASPSVTTPA